MYIDYSGIVSYTNNLQSRPTNYSLLTTWPVSQSVNQITSFLSIALRNTATTIYYYSTTDMPKYLQLVGHLCFSLLAIIGFH